MIFSPSIYVTRGRVRLFSIKSMIIFMHSSPIFPIGISMRDKDGMEKSFISGMVMPTVKTSKS